jgi:CxxC motif-containing protein
LEINGQQCKRGEEYCVRSCPTREDHRILRADQRRDAALCSVRLTKAIPKREIFNVMREINKVRLAPPVSIGMSSFRTYAVWAATSS